jgi:hypothetical protein
MMAGNYQLAQDLFIKYKAGPRKPEGDSVDQYIAMCQEHARKAVAGPMFTPAPGAGAGVQASAAPAEATDCGCTTKCVHSWLCIF